MLLSIEKYMKMMLSIKKYILSEKAHHSNLKALQTGLLVFQDLVFLGASPDGLSNCDCCQSPKLLEVECLYSGRYLDPKEAAIKTLANFSKWMDACN